MSLIVATQDRIVADCYFATEGGPRRPFKKVRKITNEEGTVIVGFVGYSGCGETMIGVLEQILNEHGKDFIAGLQKDWSALIAPYASESMASTEALVLFRAQGSNETIMIDLDGKGYVIDLPETDFFSIGYVPATAFITGYLQGKKPTAPNLHKAIKVTSKFMDFVDGSNVFEESFDDQRSH